MVTPEMHVRIALSGDLSRLAEVLARSGVWAITREAKHGDSYRVTHVPSGRCLTMRWESLDQALAQFNDALPRLQEFILPAGSRASSQAHVCRTVARRAERSVVALGTTETLHDLPRQFLNRLSDLMFVLARTLNRWHGGDDVYWKSDRLKNAE